MLVEEPSVLVIVADDDRPLVQPLVDALADGGRGVVFDPDPRAEAALLVASPRAAATDHVERLLTTWTNAHPAQSVLIVLVDGDLHWDIETDSFDEAASSALSPAAQSRFVTRPLWLDARRGVSPHLATRVLAALVPEESAPSTPMPPAQVSGVPPPAAAMPPPAASRRATRTRWLLIAGALACLVAVVIVLLLRSGGESPESGLPDPDEASRTSPWVFLVTGLGVGLALGLTIGWWRRHTRRSRSTGRSPQPAISTSSSTTPQQPAVAPEARATVFISHSFDTDHELALRLAADLGTDADVWVAPESIAPGESWISSVERGLGASEVFLALLSTASLASPWVLKEIQAAMELEIQSRLRLVPVQVEECEVPILLRTYQTLRLATGYPELVEQTRRVVHAS